MNSNGTLVPYIRQSRRREQTISLDEQKRHIDRWASANGVPLAPAIEEKGVSGNKPWRERELGRIVERCERGEVAGIIVAFQDRLSRENGLGTAEVWEALKEADARLVAAAEGLDTAKGDQELTFTIKSAIARDQWKRYGTNGMDARRNAIERGKFMGGKVPFGYLKDSDSHLYPDPDKAEAVRAIYAMRASGATWRQLKEHLEGLGLKPREGDFWTYQGIRRICTNPVYLGRVGSGEFEKERAHEPLVDRATWLAASKSRTPNRTVRGPGEGALLAGLVYCEHCGGRLTPEGHRYRCKSSNGKSATRECETPAIVSKKKLEPYVTKAFIDHFDTLLGEMERRHERPELKPLKRDLRHAQDALDVLVKDPASLAALSSGERTEILTNAKRGVVEAQAAIDEAEGVDLRDSYMFRLKDLFEPIALAGKITRADGSVEESERSLDIPVRQARQLLTLSINRITVKQGRGPVEDRVEIEFAK
jgi:DNA invertase Pin-like site-specific DNA recombinase